MICGFFWADTSQSHSADTWSFIMFCKMGRKPDLFKKKRNYYPLTGTLKVSVCSQGMCWCFRSYLYMPEYVLRWWETLCSASHVPSKPRTKEEGEDKKHPSRCSRVCCFSCGGSSYIGWYLSAACLTRRTDIFLSSHVLCDS